MHACTSMAWCALMQNASRSQLHVLPLVGVLSGKASASFLFDANLLEAMPEVCCALWKRLPRLDVPCNKFTIALLVLIDQEPSLRI